MADDDTCEACGKKGLVSKNVKDFAYPTPMGQVTIEGETPLEECPHCGEIFLPGLLVEQWNRLILTHLGRKEGGFGHKEVQFLLRVLPFTKDEFAQLLEVDVERLTALASGAKPLDLRSQEVLKAMLADYLAGKHTVH
ncbi:MAG TPA: YgiT-type zinc finger protein [Bdellovibrionota bacterium]|jgi:YgiT-type zinc finger domain-containing protein|nr:YgiT-type zinc finger protein [Bdellovibrionota bacterium]